MSDDARELALEFGAAVCREFSAMLQSEHRYDVLEASYAARACLDQAEAIFEWPETAPPPRVWTTAERSAIAACPQPFWHETHRYCPTCPWTEEFTA